uniref:Somatostatin/Cortistatin C-terminal domain-containing protein n=1 Tax=Poecilia latipinna TaxID=48699 RepID=A0A3B3V1R3_9TELE
MLCSQMKVLFVALQEGGTNSAINSSFLVLFCFCFQETGSVLLQDLTGLLLLRFMSELMASREEMLREKQEEEEEELGGRQKLMRRHIRFTHRERKAGCRNFFWKTFTSC